MTDSKPIWNETWPLKKIKPYEHNARVHSAEQIKLLAKLMQRHGIDQPIVVDEQGVIIKGHGRRLAAMEAGFKEFPVVIHRDLSEDDKRALRIADNQVTLLAGWDSALLSMELEELRKSGFDLGELGFGDMDLASLLEELRGPVPPEEPPIPELPKNPVSKRGDLWLLGPHRILCGDCRDEADVRRLMAGARINVGFTSPPYAEQRDYDEGSGFKPIPPEQYVQWFAAVSRNVAEHLAPDGSWFVNIKASADGLDTYLYVFDLVLAHVREWGWHFATEFCWERNGVPKAVTRRFKNQFEPIYQFARGEWKMRPWAVMHPSNDVPFPAGPGVGPTTWKTAQGAGKAIFGAGMMNSRIRGLGVGPTTASRLQGLPGAGSAEAKAIRKEQREKKNQYRGMGVTSGDWDKRQGHPGAYGKGGKKGFPTAEANQGTNWQKGAPLGVPLEEIGEGMAYPGNRLPSFISSHDATGHAAAFPVGLPEFFIKAFSDAGDVVFDPFMGSGSTLLAADRSGRPACGMEISPAYVDVIIERWQKASGGRAKLLAQKKAPPSKGRRAGVARDQAAE